MPILMQVNTILLISEVNRNTEIYQNNFKFKMGKNHQKILY